VPPRPPTEHRLRENRAAIASILRTEPANVPNPTRRRLLPFLAAFACASTLPAIAQQWPSKPIRLIVPGQPGGGLDLVGRTIGEQLAGPLGQSIVIDNMPGAGGIIASQSTVRAAPDGHTLLVANVGSHGTNPAVRKLPFDAVRDFTPVAMVGGTPNVLVVGTALPVTSLAEFIGYAKGNAGKVNYGTGGLGLLNHLALEQFRAAAGLEATFAHYRGISPAITDLLGGQIQVLMPGLAAALPHVKSRKMRPLAVTGRARHALLPDVPTFEESGYKDFDGVQWYGIVGPAKLPAAIVTRLNEEINKAIRAPALQQRLASEALETMPMSPEAFGQFIRNDITHWSALAKARNISLDD